jgi:hypothetical protein
MPFRVVVETLELPRKTLRGLSRLAGRNRERGVSRDEAMKPDPPR